MEYIYVFGIIGESEKYFYALSFFFNIYFCFLNDDDDKIGDNDVRVFCLGLLFLGVFSEELKDSRCIECLYLCLEQ